MKCRPSTLLDSTDRERFSHIYESSFPPDERRDVALVAELAAGGDKRFNICLAETAHGHITGLLTTWHFHDFVYVEHLAIDAGFRGRGYGSELMRRLLATVQCPVVLEVEPPVDAATQHRIEFYNRLGFVLHPDVDYLQPPYSPAQHPVPLRLMTCGHITPKGLQAAIATIKQAVYGCNGPLDKK